MGYPMELDEYDDEALLAELKRRHDRRAAGGCGYCKRTAEAHEAAPCRFWRSRESAKSAEARRAKGTT